MMLSRKSLASGLILALALVAVLVACRRAGRLRLVGL